MHVKLQQLPMARQRNSCEKFSFSSSKGKVTQGTKKPHWIQGWRMLCHKSRKMHSQTQHYSIRSSNPIFFNDLHLLCGGGFFCWVWVCCCCWVFCWFGFLGYFCLAWLVGWFVFFSRTTIHILWKCLNGEANCTSLGHRKCNLGASNSTQQI